MAAKEAKAKEPWWPTRSFFQGTSRSRSAGGGKAKTDLTGTCKKKKIRKINQLVQMERAADHRPDSSTPLTRS